MNEWIEYEKSWSEFIDEDLNKVGVLVEMVHYGKKKVLLLGDVSNFGHDCDFAGNVPFMLDCVVTRYKVLVEKDWE